MRYDTHWFQEHSVASQLKTVWIGFLLVVLGLVALVSAVIIAYPALAHIASKLF